MEEGIEKGEVCNRNGCDGIIESAGKEGSCSCHINPPCSYCTTSDEFCPKCGWDAAEEQRMAEQHVKIIDKSKDVHNLEDYRKRKEILDAQMRGLLPITELHYEIIPHTHFTQIIRGIYPDGMTKEAVRKKIDGTFGGRFTSFENNRFEFIAYTD